MKVGWLHENPGGYIGGAELTMQEFAAAAPQGVEIITDPDAQADRWVIGNWQGERPSGFRYLHDMRGGFMAEDTLIFCSPLQRARYGLEGHVIPPALDLGRFRASTNGTREGAVALGQWQNSGKGAQRVSEWATANEPVTVIGPGPYRPRGPHLIDGGEVEPGQVAETLARFDTFVHIPTVIEPFGRSVVEAWASGCQIVTNGLVGARHYIEHEPEALETAAEDLWGVVCG